MRNSLTLLLVLFLSVFAYSEMKAAELGTFKSRDMQTNDTLCINIGNSIEFTFVPNLDSIDLVVSPQPGYPTGVLPILIGSSDPNFQNYQVTVELSKVNNPNTFFHVDTVSVQLCGTFPVELMDGINAGFIFGNKNILLSWTTIWELNNKKFWIETSTNNFKKIEEVIEISAIGSGTSDIPIDYETFVSSLGNRKPIQIRLKQEDINGTITILDVIELYPPRIFEYIPKVEIKLVQDGIKLQSEYNDTVDLEITDMNGQVVLSKKNVELNARLQLPNMIPGIYIAQAISKNQVIGLSKFLR